MTSAVPPAYHAPLPELALLGLVTFLCTVLGSDRPSDCKVLKNVCQSVTTTQKVILPAYDGMPISL